MAATSTSDWWNRDNGENNRWEDTTAYASRKRKTPTSACDNVARQKIPRHGDNLPMTRPELDSPSSNQPISSREEPNSIETTHQHAPTEAQHSAAAQHIVDTVSNLKYISKKIGFVCHILFVIFFFELILWFGGIDAVGTWPPLEFLLYKDKTPSELQTALGNFEPYESALNFTSRSPPVGTHTTYTIKTMGDHEFYAFAASNERCPRQIVAEEVATMLAMGTIPETKRLPEPLQGVFWIKGNLGAQELTTLGLGTWNGTSKVLSIPNSVGTCSWREDGGSWGGIAETTCGGWAWDEKTHRPTGMRFFKFKQGEERLIGHLWASKSYAYDDSTWRASMGQVLVEQHPSVRGEFTLRSYWGLTINFKDSTLVRIATADGTPVPPGFDDYVKYREALGVGTLMWKGHVRPCPCRSEYSVPQ